MPAMTLVVAALVLGLLIGTTLVIGAPYLAIPVVAIAVAAIAFVNFRRRVERADDAHELHSPGAEESVEFTQRDRETLLPSADPEDDRG